MRVNAAVTLPADGTIDARLMLLEIAMPERPLSQYEIATACGCSRNYIAEIERRALLKLAAEFTLRLESLTQMEVF